MQKSALSFHHVDSGISLGSSGLGKAPLPAEPSQCPNKASNEKQEAVSSSKSWKILKKKQLVVNVQQRKISNG